MTAIRRSTVSLGLALLAAAVATTYAGVPVFVMLPLDAVTTAGVTNADGLKSDFQQLKNIGVTGVMSDVWWGIVEQQPQQYNWTAYNELVQLAQDSGLTFQAVMSFHQCGGNVGDACDVPLPDWVKSVGGQYDIWYQDAEGHRDEEYISLFVDEEPLFGGRTPIQIYQDFMTSFADNFASQLKNGIIPEVEISMGPAGELRYPSYQLSLWTFCGVGEFQCYGSYALANLAAAASAAGQSDWGYAGPNNAGTYDSTPSQTGFFSNGNDNYQSDYGQFFLGWYSQQLIDHGDRVLTAAEAAFGPYGVRIAGKVAGIHWWYFDESHAAELTAGYFNTDQHDAYADIASMFASHGATFDFTCLEMEDNQQPSSCSCGPFELVQQTKAAAHNAGIRYTGENALPRYDSTAYGTIEQQAAALGYLIDGFTYLRLGNTLMQSGNFGTFSQFVSSMNNLSA